MFELRIAAGGTAVRKDVDRCEVTVARVGAGGDAVTELIGFAHTLFAGFLDEVSAVFDFGVAHGSGDESGGDGADADAAGAKVEGRLRGVPGDEVLREAVGHAGGHVIVGDLTGELHEEVHELVFVLVGPFVSEFNRFGHETGQSIGGVGGDVADDGALVHVFLEFFVHIDGAHRVDAEQLFGIRHGRGHAGAVDDLLDDALFGRELREFGDAGSARSVAGLVDGFDAFFFQLFTGRGELALGTAGDDDETVFDVLRRGKAHAGAAAGDDTYFFHGWFSFRTWALCPGNMICHSLL